MLYLIRGLPGCGKSTLAHTLAASTGALVFEADDYLTDENGEYRWEARLMPYAHAKCLDNTAHALDVGHNVVVANTFVSMKHLIPYLMLAKELDVRVTVIELPWRRDNVHGVSEEAIQRMANKWQKFNPDWEKDSA